MSVGNEGAPAPMDLTKRANVLQFRQDCEVVATDGYRTDTERRLASTALSLLERNAVLEFNNAVTYKKPADGWVCFHCGERFTDPESAKEHFGESPETAADLRATIDALQARLSAAEEREPTDVITPELREEIAKRLHVLSVPLCANPESDYKAWREEWLSDADDIITLILAALKASPKAPQPVRVSDDDWTAYCRNRMYGNPGIALVAREAFDAGWKAAITAAQGEKP